MKCLIFVLLGLAAVVPPQAQAQTPAASSRPAARPAVSALPPHFVRESLKDEDGSQRQFIVYVPPAYRAADDKKWPVLIFLHGSVERGRYAVAPTTVGLGPYIAAKHINDFPFITIFPQATEMWFRGKQEEWIWKVLDAVQKKYHTDPDRVCLTGISMGGFGAWELAMHHPDRLAAIVPICGGCADLTLIGNLKGMPVYAFHGQKDQNVPIQMSRQIVQLMAHNDPPPKYVEFRGLAHVCWDQAYLQPGLFDWLLQQKRRTGPEQYTMRYPGHGVPLPWRVWWLEINEVAPGDRPPTVAVTIEGDTIILASEAVNLLTLHVEGIPIKQRKQVNISWNGIDFYRGPLDHDMSMKVPTPP